MKKVIIAEPILHAVQKDNTLFSRGGIAVFPAQSSEDIIALHREHRADLIISDFTLPVMGGVQLCSSIRGDSSLKDVSLVMVCEADNQLQAQCRQSGANAVIAKPVNAFELFTRVSELLIISQRKDIRALLHISVPGRQGLNSFPGMVHNISISGMLLEAEPELRQGERLSCVVGIGKREVAVDCLVTRTEQGPPGRFRYGVRFSNLDMKGLVIIEQFVKGRIRH